MATKKKPTAKAKEKPPKAEKPKKENKLKAVKGGKADKPPKLEVEDLSTFQDVKKTGRGNGEKPNVEKVVVAHEDITKVKLDKDGYLTITYSSINNDGSSVDRTDTFHRRTIHPDLREKLKGLRPHLALLCNYLTTQLLKDINGYSEEKLEAFEVRGISIIIKNGTSYIITGLCKNYSGKKFALNTPKTYVEEADETAYRWIDDLDTKVKDIIEEVRLYAAGTKIGEAKQTSLFKDGGDAEPPEDLDPDNIPEEEKFAEEGR